MNDGYRHSMCQECWNKQRPHSSSVGHQMVPSRRVREICCFCLQQHKSGIYVAKNPHSRELKCGGDHSRISVEKMKVRNEA
jgi:hypothetical protein